MRRKPMKANKPLALLLACLLCVGCLSFAEEAPVEPPAPQEEVAPTEPTTAPEGPSEPEEPEAPTPSPEAPGEPTPTPEAPTDPTAPTKPTPTPAPQGIAISVTGRTMEKDGVITIPAQPGAEIEFTWTAVEGAGLYEISVADAEGNILLAQSAEATSLKLNADDYTAGPYALTVSFGDLSGALTFAVSSGEFPGGRPHGGFPGGGMPEGEMEQPGFRVTPGEALTEEHASGTKSMLVHGAVACTVEGDAMQALTVGGAALNITANGADFTAAIEGDALILTAETDCTWTLGGDALRTLKKSGIASVQMRTPENIYTQDTAPKLCGETYARLRTEGVTDVHFIYEIGSDGAFALVGQARYSVTEGGEILP